jgi:hypothetical protein
VAGLLVVKPQINSSLGLEGDENNMILMLVLLVRRVGFLKHPMPKGRLKHPLLLGAGALVLPLVAINTALIALAWNWLGLHRKLHARRLGLRGCIAFGVLLIALEGGVVSIF